MVIPNNLKFGKIFVFTKHEHCLNLQYLVVKKGHAILIQTQNQKLQVCLGLYNLMIPLGIKRLIK